MTKQHKERGVVTVEIPSGLVTRIRVLIERGEYKTPTDFVREAVRRWLSELESTGQRG